MNEADLAELNGKIAVMEASKTQEIESRNTHRSRFGESCWVSDTNPSWDWDHCDYRVKPEPPTPRIFVGLEGSEGPLLSAHCDLRRATMAFEGDPASGFRKVEFIELTPEIRARLKL